MPKHQLTKEQLRRLIVRSTIKKLARQGCSAREIMERTGIKSKKQISLWIKRQGRSSIFDKRRLGRPRKIQGSSRGWAQRHLQNKAIGSIRNVKNKFASAGKKISYCGIYSVAKSSKDRHKKPRLVALKGTEKPELSEESKQERLEWAKQHQDWKLKEWKKVSFCDESPKEGFRYPQFQWVRKGQTPESKRVTKYPPRVNIFGVITYWGKSKLKKTDPDEKINAAKYQAMIANLDDHPNILEWTKRIFKNRGVWYWQQDNAPPHNAKTTLTLLKQKKVKLLPWPANSPDLNPIENIWSMISQGIGRRKVIKSKDRLWKAVEDEWNHISLDKIQALYRSMPERMNAVIEAGGDITKY